MGYGKKHSVNRLMALCQEYNVYISLNDERIVSIDSICKGSYPADTGLLPLGEPDRYYSLQATNIVLRIVEEMKKNIA